MYVEKTADQKRRLVGQAKRKYSVVSIDDLQMVQTGSRGCWRRLCNSSLVTILSWRTRNQVFRAFKGMRKDQKVFHLDGGRIGRGSGKGLARGRDLKPLVDGGAIRN